MASYIGVAPPSQTGIVERYRFSGDGSSTVFSGNDLNAKEFRYTSTNPLLVFLNGVQLVEGIDFTKTSDTQVTFTTAPANNDVIEFMSFGDFDLNSPSTTRNNLGIELNSGQILVGNSSNNTSKVTASGDATISNTGVVNVVCASGSTFDIAGQTNVSCHIIPTSNELYDLGSTACKFRDLYLSGTTICIGDAKIQYDATCCEVMFDIGGCQTKFGKSGTIRGPQNKNFASLTEVTNCITSCVPTLTNLTMSQICDANTTNWNTAYSWGDHSTAGYLTSANLGINLNSNTDVTITSPTSGQILEYNGSVWTNATNNSISLTNLSIGTNASASCSGGLSYNNTTGVFTYTPPDLSGYLTSESDTLNSVIGRGNTTTCSAVIPFYYANQSAFPSAATYHGAIAHSHSDGAMYFAHSGCWNKLANDSQLANSSNWDTAYGWGDHSTAGYLTSQTSHADVLVDGDFTSSGLMATNGCGTYSIVTNNSSNWDTAYGWGDHSTAGYLTSYTESDPTVGTHIKNITTTNISNWNTAYGWGDHSSQGYLTSISNLSINTLSDVDTSSCTPTNGQALVWNSTSSVWVPGNVASSGIALTDLSVTQNSASGSGSLTYNNTTGVFTYTPPSAGSSNVTSIDDLSDVDISSTSPTNGQALVWNSTTAKFEPGTVSSGSGGSSESSLVNGTKTVTLESDGEIKLANTTASISDGFDFTLYEDLSLNVNGIEDLQTSSGTEDLHTVNTLPLTPVTFDTYSATEYRTVKYVIQAVSINELQSLDVLVTHNDKFAYVKTLDTLNTGYNLVTISAELLNGNVNVKFTPNWPETTIDFVKTSLPSRSFRPFDLNVDLHAVQYGGPTDLHKINNESAVDLNV